MGTFATEVAHPRHTQSTPSTGSSEKGDVDKKVDRRRAVTEVGGAVASSYDSATGH